MHVWRVYRRLVAFVWALSLGLGMVTFMMRSAATAVSEAINPHPYAVLGNPILINELDSDQEGIDSGEFIELYDGGVGNTPLDGLVLVAFNGSNDLSYNLSPFTSGIDLDGFTTDADGYFVIGNTAVPGVDLIFNNNTLQNGADAVALYLGDGSDFPSGTAVTTTNLIDALVYDTSDPDDPGLLILLNPGQPQVNENGGGDGTAHANQRCPNGAGGPRNTITYVQRPPTPGAANDCPPDLHIAKTGPALALSGDILTYTISYSSTGAATAVLMTDTLPTGLTYISDTSGLPCPTCPTGPLVWSVGTMSAGSSYSFTLVTAVPLTMPTATLANTVTIASPDGDTNPADNTAVHPTTFYTVVPIAQARAGNVGELFAVEGQVIYKPGTYNLSGWGVQDDSGGIGVFYNPPPALQLGDTVRLVATRGSFQNEEQLNAPVYHFAHLGSGPEVMPLPFTTGQIAAGSSEGWLAIISGTVSNLLCPTQFYLDDGTGAALVYVDVDTGIDVCGGGLQNGMTAVVAGFSTQYQDEYEIKPRRPTDVEFTAAAPNLSKNAPVRVGPGQLFTYTLTLYNNLGYTLTDVVITDPVPALVNFAYALDGGSYADGVVSWPRPSLPHQSSATVRFAVSAPLDTAVIENRDYTISATNFSTPTVGPPLFTMVISGAVSIHHIQGAQHSSLLVGEVVTGVQGVVTAVSGSGFFFQNLQPDDDEATSEGIFVYTAGNPSINVGDLISVTGLVDEFTSDGLGSGNLSTTQLRDVHIDLLATDQLLPAPVIMGVNGRVPPNQIIDNDSHGDVNQTPNFDPDEDGIDFYESLEGMLVQVDGGVVVGTTFFNEVIVVGDSGANGGLFSLRGALVVRDDDFNPERIFIDDTLVPAPANYRVGDAFTAPITGVLDYGFGNFKLLNVNPLPPIIPGGLTAETTTLSSAADRLTIATFNMENLSAQSDPARFEALAAIIVDNLGAPDIIALVEVQDNNGPADNGVVDASATYQMLLGAIIDAGGPLYDFRDIPPEDNQDGGQPGGNIRVGFIFQPARVMFVDRPGGTAVAPTNITMGSQGVELSYSPGRIAPQHPAFSNSRKPLAGEFLFNGYKLILIANHFNSKGGDGPLFGRQQPPFQVTQAKRLAQAQVVADFVQQIVDLDEQAHVVVLGDLNDFHFAPPLLALEESGLTNLITWLPEEERYTYIFQGNAQVLDHILVSEYLAAYTAVAADIVHVNSEFRLNEQASDHDPVIAQFTMPPLSAGFSSNSPVGLGELSTFNNTSVGATTYVWDFGDGVGTSTAVNPTYQYTAFGTYTVTLTAVNILGQQRISAPHTIVPPHYRLFLPLVLNR